MESKIKLHRKPKSDSASLVATTSTSRSKRNTNFHEIGVIGKAIMPNFPNKTTHFRRDGRVPNMLKIWDNTPIMQVLLLPDMSSN